MTATVDLTGQRFERLRVLHRLPPVPNQRVKWLCVCECGTETAVSSTHLRSGHTKSCGCMRNDLAPGYKHGMAGTPTFKTWVSMFARCTNPKNPNYKKYGGRGIRISPEWYQFDGFLRDMGERPSLKHTIERIDVNKGYEKSNCVWTDDASMQAFNQNRKSNNTSGCSGVYWQKSCNKWVAKTFKGGKTQVHGYFEDFNDAVAARRTAEREIYGRVKADE